MNGSYDERTLDDRMKAISEVLRFYFAAEVHVGVRREAPREER